MKPSLPAVIDDGFVGYGDFVEELRGIAYGKSPSAETQRRVAACLDGAAGKELARLVPLPLRREHGVFFTGSKLSSKMLAKVDFTRQEFIYDPAVGAGDLLLAAARKLGVGKNLKATLVRWGSCLGGTDLQAEFIEATKLRLAILAREMHGSAEELPTRWKAFFEHVRIGNGLTARAPYRKATCVIMNPPYTVSTTCSSFNWASGQISNAALFVATALERIEAGTRLFAILPEVLRSGSFQEKWRCYVSDLAEVEKVNHHGVFDEKADIDVFLLSAKRRKDTNPLRRWPARRAARETVQDYFEVHVGPVVPHRDPEEGPLLPYVHARCALAWTTMSKFSEKRKYLGRSYRPPFVVIRRTSRPGQSHRAVATIVRGTVPVAVENHLVVCTPKSGTLRDCSTLMRHLKAQAVDDFLDRRICCRHLTVSAVKAIPYAAA